MKITAEFNSNEELLNFIKVFGETQINNQEKSVVGIAKEKEITTKENTKKVENETVKKEDIKKNEKVEKVEAEIVGVEETVTEIKDADQKVTKEEVRAVFTKLIKSGKQKEAKELTAKYGAAKLPDVKEEDYAAIKEEAEALM